MAEKKICKCGNEFVRYDTIQKKCVPCGLSEAREKERIKQVKKFHKVATRKSPKANKDNLSHQLELTQEQVNKLARLRDKDRPCISCGTKKPGIKYDAGHYKTVGGHNELRFNLKNIHLQCSQVCNVYGAGKAKEYAAGILERYGHEYLDYLDGHHERIKYTCQDLKAFRLEVRAIIREMESGLPYREPSLYQDN